MSPASPATNNAAKTSKSSHPAKSAKSAKKQSVAGAQVSETPVYGPYGTILVTPIPNSSQCTFAPGPNNDPAVLDVESNGDLTLHWRLEDTLCEIAFELTPEDGDPTGWSLSGFTLGLKGSHIPEGKYQPMWRTWVCHKSDANRVNVLMERPPINVVDGGLADFEFTIGYEHVTEKPVLIDPRMTNKGDG